tara:strand:+ start:182 stop:559 length:378 start_codon:yes stop_codon:yes gene_type:complete
MTRTISIGQIGDAMNDQVVELVKKTTLEWTKRVKKDTPVWKPEEGETGVGGTLRNAWQTKIEPLKGLITNATEYAEPVVYGTNLPRSWGGEYRTRQGTIPGYPDISAKEIEKWVQPAYEKIKRSI